MATEPIQVEFRVTHELHHLVEGTLHAHMDHAAVEALLKRWRQQLEDEMLTAIWGGTPTPVPSTEEIRGNFGAVRYLDRC